MYNKYSTILFIITFCFGNVNESQIKKVGFVGAQFLKIEVGARGFGMGNAIDPVINDASAVFWNPAGLTQSPNRSFFSSNGEYLFGTKQSAMSITKLTIVNKVNEYSSHPVHSFKDVIHWYKATSTTDEAKLNCLYKIFDTKLIKLLVSQIMESNKVKYLDRYALPLSEVKLKKRSTWNGWIGIILTQQIKSRRDTVSMLIYNTFQST